MFALVIAASAKGNAAAHPVAAQTQRGVCGAALLVLAIKQGGKSVFRKLLKRRGKLKLEALAQSLEGLLVAAEHLFCGPGQQCARVQRKAHVGRDEARLKIIHPAKAHTTRASPLRPVERKKLRAGRWQRNAAVRAHRGGGMHGVGLLPGGGLVRLVQHKAALAIT